jgi:hypothetical protein
MSNEIEKKMIIIAIFKGVMHAIVVPLVILLMVNISSNFKYGFASALLYLALASIVYAKSETKYISKIVFFGIWKGIVVLALLYALLIIT